VRLPSEVSGPAVSSILRLASGAVLPLSSLLEKVVTKLGQQQQQQQQHAGMAAAAAAVGAAAAAAAAAEAPAQAAGPSGSERLPVGAAEAAAAQSAGPSGSGRLPVLYRCISEAASRHAPPPALGALLTLPLGPADQTDVGGGEQGPAGAASAPGGVPGARGRHLGLQLPDIDPAVEAGLLAFTAGLGSQEGEASAGGGGGGGGRHVAWSGEGYEGAALPLTPPTPSTQARMGHMLVRRKFVPQQGSAHHVRSKTL
jgi:hypothetical protein